MRVGALGRIGLRRHLGLIVAPVVLAAGTAFILSVLADDLYRSTAEVVIDPSLVLDTEVDVAAGSEVVSAAQPGDGTHAELSVAAAGESLLGFTASSSNAEVAAASANAYAEAYLDLRGGDSAELTDEASVPSDPYSPRVVRNTVLAALVGLLIGVIAVAVVALTDRTIRSAGQLNRVSGVPNLAMVPRQPIGEERPDDVAILRDRNSVEAEGYRALRTALDFVLTDIVKDSGHVVLVTSPRPGEGKSTVAANLAAAAAIDGRDVVLVDADLRRPQVHRLFGLDNQAGLSSVLAGASAVKESVRRVSDEFDLVLLTSGPPPDDPAEVLSGGPLQELLSGLSRSADLVIIDAPPVLPATDPAIVAQHCDAVLMVATADLSDRREWVEALERLAVVEAKVIGTALLSPDRRVQATPSYRYAPTAAPRNWWVSTPQSAAKVSFVWPTPNGHAVAPDAVENPPVITAESIDDGDGDGDGDERSTWERIMDKARVTETADDAANGPSADS